MLDAILSAADNEGLRIGLIATTLGFGLRHGIDWDHIAAITDITSSQDLSRASMIFATLYALGHGAVVFCLGVVAILLGDLLPDSVDGFMGRIVGVTLIILGVYVVYSLVKHGRDFRMRSRWMLIFSGVRHGTRWLRSRVGARAGGEPAGDVPVEHEHEHVAGTPHHADVETVAQTATSVVTREHAHSHKHVDGDAFMTYGRGTSFVIGMIHGIGAETPTQVLIFLAAAGAGGPILGVFLLLVFVVGLLISNSGIALAATFGFLNAGKSFAVYATVAAITAFFSLVLGVLFLLDKGAALPAIFGG